MVRRFIRKFRDGGILAPNDPAIPTANVHIYARSRYGDTFHLHSLEEGLLHLLSNEGYRLSIWEYPDSGEAQSGRAGVTIYRNGDNIATVVHSQYNEWIPGGVKNVLNFRLGIGSGQEDGGFGQDFCEILIDGS